MTRQGVRQLTRLAERLARGELKARLEEWTLELDPPGMPAHEFIPVEGQYYKFYFNVD